MSNTMIKYFKVSKISFINSFEYRLDFIFGLLVKFFPAVIQYCMWTAIFANSQDKIILNYTYNQIVLYTVISIFVASIISVDVHVIIAGDIKSGALSKYIILPINHFWYRVFNFIGHKILDLMFISIGIIVVICCFQFKGIIKINIIQGIIFILVTMMALVLQYLISYCISSVAFWIGECGGVFTVVNVISSIVSGAIFPLDIFGKTVVEISRFFPFYYIGYFPTNVFIGKIHGSEIILAMCVMIIWFFILSCLAIFLWEKGMKKYVAIGG